MKDTNKADQSEVSPSDSGGRRAFLMQLAVTGLATSALGIAGTTQAVSAPQQPQQPAADSGRSYPMPSPNAKTEKEFRMGVIGPATLSLETSQIAITKATNAKAKEFANFELREAIAVTSVLKGLGTPVPPMDAQAKATLKKIKDTPKGAAFDKAYIMAQTANHEFLRDLATSYLKNSAAATGMPEMHGRNLATLSLATFKEHVVITKDIAQALMA